MSRRVATQRRARLGGAELALADPLLERIESSEREVFLRRRAELAPLPPVAERSSLAEPPWMKQIEQLARQLQVYCYHPKLSRWSARGWPDLSLLGKRALWIECKADDGQLTEEQVRVIDLMLACGLEVHVLRPWHGLRLVADILTGQAAGGASRCRPASALRRGGEAATVAPTSDPGGEP